MRDKGGVMGGLVLPMRSVTRDEATGLDSFFVFVFFSKSWSVDFMEGKMMASQRCPPPRREYRCVYH